MLETSRVYEFVVGDCVKSGEARASYLDVAKARLLLRGTSQAVSVTEYWVDALCAIAGGPKARFLLCEERAIAKIVTEGYLQRRLYKCFNEKIRRGSRKHL